MEYIINTFDKDLMYKLAYKLNGKIVSEENETLVIVNYKGDEYNLQQYVEDILETGNFRITEKTTKDYHSKANFYKLINWGELSRLLSGNRSSITRKRIPAIHQEKINKLISLLEDWYRNDAKTSKSSKPEKDDA